MPEMMLLPIRVLALGWRFCALLVCTAWLEANRRPPGAEAGRLVSYSRRAWKTYTIETRR